MEMDCRYPVGSDRALLARIRKSAARAPRAVLSSSHHLLGTMSASRQTMPPHTSHQDQAYPMALLDPPLLRCGFSDHATDRNDHDVRCQQVWKPPSSPLARQYTSNVFKNQQKNLITFIRLRSNIENKININLASGRALI